MARRYTKGVDLWQAQKRRFELLQVSRRLGHRDLALQGLQDARELTSGGLSRKQTRGAFARGASPALSTATGLRRQLTARQRGNRGLGKGGAPLLPINIQSGKLNKSFYLIPRDGGTIQRFDLSQNDPGGGIYRLLPGGTKKMIDSGYKAEMRRRWQARNKAFMDHYRAQQSRS